MLAVIKKIVVFSLLSLWFPPLVASQEGSSSQPKKAAMIIAHRDFRDEELIEPRNLLDDAGIEVTVVSTSLEPARGILGTRIKPDLLIDDLDVEGYDAIIFVGGPGARQYWDDPRAHEFARQALQQGKILAAICIAPVTLAKAGVLEGRSATVWPSEAKALKAQGARYTASDVETDGNIITADGPGSAGKFGEAILAALTQRK
jgi:protease I